MSAKINNPPAKIMLNQSTKISLNDRFSQFTKVRRAAPAAAQQQQSIKMNRVRPGANNNHTNTAKSNLAQKAASAKNRRLALQMANRPSVQAALKIKKKSIRQRLGIGKARAAALINRKPRTAAGGGIAARLSGLKRGAGGKGALRQRIGRGGGIRRRLGGVGGGIQSRLSNGSLIIRRGGNGLRRGNGGRGRGLKARLNNIVNKQGANNNNGTNGSLNTSLTQRRNAISAAGNAGGTTRFYNRNNNNRRGGFNNNRRRGGGRGGQRRGGNQQQRHQLSKESLDNDLNQYMSKTKAGLDADLNSYMSQSH